jgi:hypothetical protein
MMSVEQSVEWVAEETEVLEEDLRHCHFVRHKSHTTCPGSNPGRLDEKAATNRMSYSTAFR